MTDEELERRRRRRLAVAYTLGLGYGLGWINGAGFILRLLYRSTR